MSRRWCLCICFAACLGCISAQTDESEVARKPEPSREETHILGIVPDYDTVRNPNGTIQPISAKTKWWLATEDNFDPFSFLVTGIYAGVYQGMNEYPEFRQGAVGYAKRYSGALADGVIGNYMSEGLFPVMLHQDPRLFRMGPSGGFWKRVGYSASRVLVTRGDSGARQFNFSEIGGNAAAAGLAAVYYPSSGRKLEDFFDRWGVSVASDAGFNILREFWPDMRRKMFGR